MSASVKKKKESNLFASLMLFFLQYCCAACNNMKNLNVFDLKIIDSCQKVYLIKITDFLYKLITVKKN